MHIFVFWKQAQHLNFMSMYVFLISILDTALQIRAVSQAFPGISLSVSAVHQKCFTSSAKCHAQQDFMRGVLVQEMQIVYQDDGRIRSLFDDYL